MKTTAGQWGWGLGAEGEPRPRPVFSEDKRGAGPGAAKGTAPEVPAVVGDSLSRAVGGGGLQHHNLHLLAGVALSRGHGALPLP